MKRKVCKTDKIFVEGDICPICKKDSFSNTWQGRIFFLDTKRSFVAHEMGVTHKGEYAIKVR